MKFEVGYHVVCLGMKNEWERWMGYEVPKEEKKRRANRIRDKLKIIGFKRGKDWGCNSYRNDWIYATPDKDKAVEKQEKAREIFRDEGLNPDYVIIMTQGVI